MERRALLAAVLSILVIMAWQYLFAPPAPVPGSKPAVTAQAPKPTAGPSPTAVPAVATMPPAAPATPAVVSGLPKATPKAEGKLFTAIFTTEGGTLKSFQLKNYTSWFMGPGLVDTLKSLAGVDKKANVAPTPFELLQGPTEGKLTLHAEGLLTGLERYALVSSSDSEVVFSATVGSLQVEKRFKLKPDDYRLGLEITLTNQGSAPLTLSPYLELQGEYFPKDAGAYAPQPEAIYRVDGSVSRVGIGKALEKPVTVAGEVSWAGIDDKYFLRVLMPQQGGGSVTVVEKGEKHLFTRLAPAALTLPVGQPKVLSYQLFLGPKQSDILYAAGRDLQKALNYGWLGVFAEPMLWLLKRAHGLVGSWGVSIILLTVVVRLLLYPLMIKQFESTQKMKEYQPEMNAIRERFKDDKNRMNQEMMRFMQENKINPLGGCLPVLMQMPIWFALYRVLQNSIELYHTSFLYLPDLSAQDPYGVSPLLLGVLMYLQQKLTPQPPGMDPVQAKMMQYMPLIFAVVMFSLPSGLVVYILVNTVLGIAQQWYFNEKANRRAPSRPALAK